MDEPTLIAAARYGDQQAFAALVARYQHGLLTTAYQYVGNLDEAQDLAQETWVEVFRHLGALRDAASFRGWLFAIMRRKGLRLVKSRRQHEPLDDYLDSLPAPSTIDDGRLAELLQQLPLADREILAARYLQELEYEEIARALHISVRAARMRCLRARERLKALAHAEDERDMRERLQRGMGVLLVGLPLEESTHRVLEEVTTMSTGQATSAAAAHTSTLLAQATTWKVAAGLVGVLALGGAALTFGPRFTGGHHAAVPTAVTQQEEHAPTLTADPQLGSLEPMALDAEANEKLVRDIIAGMQQNYDAMQSGRGTLKRQTRFRAMPGKGWRTEGEAVFQVAFAGKRLRIASTHTLLHDATKPERVGEVMREIAARDETALRVWKSINNAITLHSNEASRNYNWIVSEHFGRDRFTIGPEEAKKLERPVPGIRIVGKQQVDGRECIVVDVDRVMFRVETPEKLEAEYPTRYWVDEQRGYTVPLMYAWVIKDGEGEEVRQHAREGVFPTREWHSTVRKYGNGVWAIGESRKREYETKPDAEGVPQRFVRLEEVLTVSPDFVMNIPVSDKELAPNFPPDAKEGLQP